MAIYRDELPQLSGDLFLTDGGLETTLIFHDRLEVPSFATFVLLEYDEGRAALRKYFNTYASLAAEYGVGMILESATWRANPDWGAALGCSPDALAGANRAAIELLTDVRTELESEQTKLVISGCIGPRADGYKPTSLMSEREAEQYHSTQIGVFRETDADMVSAFTLNYVEEAVGVTRAAVSADMPVAISFTVETDGKLPTGQTLESAIEAVDEATDAAPAYYMINCAHPTHFEDVLVGGGLWVTRIRGLRANASSMSHAELDENEELDDGDPVQLGAQLSGIRAKLEHISVLGGCCGTDHRHIAEIAKACLARG